VAAERRDGVEGRQNRVGRRRAVVEGLDPGLLEARLDVVLRPYTTTSRPQRQDALGVGVDERADLRQRFDLGRKWS
jgi:hypothetical protein